MYVKCKNVMSNATNVANVKNVKAVGMMFGVFLFI